MIANIKNFTSAIKKISDLTSGDKIIPGVLLKLANKDGEDKLSICYSDGHKSLIEEIGVTIEEGDHTGDIVVSFEQMARAVENCQPSGIIKVEDMHIQYLSDNIIRISAEQFMEVVDGEGNVLGNRNLAIKKMDLSWQEPGSDMKSAILSRMKYDSIFEADGIPDEYSRVEMIDALSRTSVEKGKNIYISANVQSIFVANQAHVTAVPISQYEVSDEEKVEIETTLKNEGRFSEQEFAKEVQAKGNRVHQSVVMTQSVAKSLIGILNKCSSDNIQVHRKDKYCNIIIENDSEKVGIWFEMAQASKAHIGALERYNSLEYKTYQILFLREFLSNNIKSAIDSSKNDKIAIEFKPTELDNPTTKTDLVIISGNASASIADTYRVNPDDIIDTLGDIEGKRFNVSLKVLSDMMAQLKTDYVALDINVGEGDVTCIRLAEVDGAKMAAEYDKARARTKELYEQQNIPFDANATPTPVEIKTGYRVNTLITKQYTILTK